MSDKLRAELLSCALFKDVSLAELAELKVQPRQKSFTSNQLVLDREEQSYDVYFLKSGRVFAVFFTEEGRELIFGRVGIGSYFGELSALDNAPRSLSVYAHRQASVLVITQVEFLKVIDEIPLVRTRVIKGMTKRIRNLTERSYQAATLSVEKRVRSYLVRLALEAGAMRHHGEIKDAPTHMEIANSVGSNREAVSRVMSELNKTGLIESGRQRIKLLAPDAILEQSLF